MLTNLHNFRFYFMQQSQNVMHKIYHGVTFYKFCVGNVIERFLYLLDNAKKELSLCYKLGFIKLDAKIYGLAKILKQRF